VVVGDGLHRNGCGAAALSIVPAGSLYSLSRRGGGVSGKQCRRCDDRGRGGEAEAPPGKRRGHFPALCGFPAAQGFVPGGIYRSVIRD